MNWMFYIVAAITLIATVRVITHPNVVYALLYFVVSLLSVALIFYMIGAPFVAALEVIIYAGAILVLFLFVIMMLNFREEHEKHWLRKRIWAGPGVLCAALLAVTIAFIAQGPMVSGSYRTIEPSEVGNALFGPYLIAVQLAALLLLSGLVGSSHLRRHERGSLLRKPEGGDSQ